MRLFVILSLISSVMSDCVGVFSISCGGSACVALMTDGTAQAWGNSNYGGDITCGLLDASVCTPLPVGVNLTNIVDVSCGKYACIALKNDGRAYAWGHTTKGGTAPTLSNITDISCGGHACVARKDDGKAYVWGDPANGGDITCGSLAASVCTPLSVPLTNVADISCGNHACVARMNDGHAYAWGASRYGGNSAYIAAYSGGGPSYVTLTNIADISCAYYVCAALKNNGDAVTWGMDSRGGDVPSSVDLTNVASISCGNGACVALKNDNTAYAWGDSGMGGSVPSSVTLTEVVDISCGGFACVARKNDSTAYAWGFDGRGGRSDVLTEIADISCGENACAAINKDGTVVTWGISGSMPGTSPYVWHNASHISCSGKSCAVFMTDGTAVAWGSPSTLQEQPTVPVGSYKNVDWTKDQPSEPPIDLCLQCPLGTYQNETNKDSCKSCPSGTSSLSPGSMKCFTALEIKAKFVEERNPTLVPAYNVANSC